MNKHRTVALSLAAILLTQSPTTNLEPGFYTDGTVIAERATNNSGVSTPANPVIAPRSKLDGKRSPEIARLSTVAIRQKGLYICSGALVKHSTTVNFAVLTSLSCIDRFTADSIDELEVVYGKKIGDISKALRVDSLAFQKGKASRDISRLAILGLETDQLPQDLQAIPIRQQNTFIRYGHFILFAGYGASSNGKNDSGQVLKYRELYYSDPTNSSIYPAELFSDIAIIHRHDEIIAKNNEAKLRSDGIKVTSCKGDEGSPAIDISFDKWSIFAIKGPVNHCEAPRNYAIDLRFHQRWIDEAILHVNNPTSKNQVTSLEYVKPEHSDRTYFEKNKGTKNQEIVPINPKEPGQFWRLEKGSVARLFEVNRKINESNPSNSPVQLKKRS